MDVNYRIVRSKKRKKTISLQVKADGTAVVYAPYRTPMEEIDTFFNEKKMWLLKKIGENEKRLIEIRPKKYVTGETFLFLGMPYQLNVEYGSNGCDALTFSSGQFVLTGENAYRGRELFISWYQKRTKEYIGERIDYYSRTLELCPNGVRISSARCRWGSCSPSNHLSFSWRLAMAPCAVIDYVVVHELSHMKEKNHSVHFWNLVAKILPHYKLQRRWLKENGHLLHI